MKMSEEVKNAKNKFILVQSLDNSKRVRLLDGSLTPVFEYSSQAFKYSEGKGIFNCDILRI